MRLRRFGMNGRHCYRMSSQARNNGVFSFFEGLDESSRTLMVIIPHEDDEINLAGAVIYHARKLGIRVICVFTTNGDWKYPGFICLKEVIQALAVLGVPEKDIVFLGYPDGGVHGERNVFVNGRKRPLIGRNGQSETYGMDNHADFAMQYRGGKSPGLYMEWTGSGHKRCYSTG